MATARPGTFARRGLRRLGDRQRIVVGTLETLPAKAVEAGIRPPALLIVGEVVSLAGKLAWFSPAGAAVQAA